MRWLLLFALAGCGDGMATADANVADADVCAKAPALAPNTCRRAAFVTLSLDGTWTFNGTRQLDAGTQSYSSPVAIVRTGTGWCQLNLDFGSTAVTSYRDPSTYVDDTFATHSLSSGTNRSEWTLCVNGSSGDLTYHSESYYVMGGNQHWDVFDGVLTR